MTLTIMAFGILGNCRGEHLQRAKWANLSVSQFGYFNIIQLTHDTSKNSRASDFQGTCFVDLPSATGFSVTALLNWLSEAQPENSTHIFTNNWRKKWYAITTATIRRWLKRVAQCLQLNPALLIGAHSMRVAATSAANATGATIEAQRGHGKWGRRSTMPTYYDARRHTIGAAISAECLAKHAPTRKLRTRWIQDVHAARSKIMDMGGSAQEWNTFPNRF